jgi:hypothetical protein
MRKRGRESLTAIHRFGGHVFLLSVSTVMIGGEMEEGEKRRLNAK